MTNISKTLKRVENHWQSLGNVAADRANKMGASCAKGCSHCCYLLTTISVADAVLIAERLLRKPDWLTWLPRLADDARASFHADGSAIGREDYFDNQQPCSFLSDGLCSVYEQRPVACRTHFVTTEPSRCSSVERNARVSKVDVQDLEMEGARISTQFGGGEFLYGPLPLMVMHGLLALVETRRQPKFAEKLKAALAGLPAPQSWMASYAESEGLTNVLKAVRDSRKLEFSW